MKKRLNITISDDLLDEIKGYAEQHNTSISSLVEEHFEALVKPKPKLKNGMSLVDYVKSLPKFDIPDDYDYKEDYFRAKAKKMGYEDLL